MTKKRFIKLLMSHGIQRNEAHEIAGNYNSRNISYAAAYKLSLFGYSISKRILDRVAGLIKHGMMSVNEARRLLNDGM